MKPTILAYDLKNEPQFDLIALSVYPDAPPPLQTDRLISLYGERIAPAAIPAYRQTGEGRALVPAAPHRCPGLYLRQRYRLYREFLDAGASWVATHPDKTTLDYMDSPDRHELAPVLRRARRHAAPLDHAPARRRARRRRPTI